MVFINLKIRGNISLINQKEKKKSIIKNKDPNSMEIRLPNRRPIISIGGDKIQIKQKTKVYACVIMREIQGSLMPPPPFNSIRSDCVSHNNWFVRGKIEINHSCNRTYHKYQRIHR